ncbi:MAG: hypothetical protein ACAH88_19540 [Roseimicrobium sp.]
MKIDRISTAEYRRRYADACVKADVVPSSSARPRANAAPQIRVPKLRQPNKTEAAWMARLKVLHPNADCTVLYEPFTLRLPSGTRYTPDAVVLCGSAIVEVWEVKGAYLHNAAFLRAWKEARAAFPFWRFGFAQLRGTEWTVAMG